MSCAGSPGLARAFSANRQWADTSSTALEQSAVVISEHYLPPTVINYLSAHCLSPRHSSRRSFYFSARCLSISCFFCFHLLSLNTLSLFLPPSLTVYPPPSPTLHPSRFLCQLRGYPPCKHETDQCADEDHHLVEHG